MDKRTKLAPLSVAFLLANSVALAAEDGPTMTFAGRIQADHTRYDGGSFPYADGSEVRRLRAGVLGNLTSVWEYKAEWDFAPDDVEVKDAYIRYTGFTNTRITLGNFKVFSSIDELTSSNNTTFTERGLPNAFVTARRTALGYQTWSDNFSFSAATYIHEPNNLERGTGNAVRYIYHPKLGNGALLHLGINAAIENPDDNTARLRSRPELHQDAHRFVDTGNLLNVDSTTKLGLEAAYTMGRFSAQSEYVRKSVDRDGVTDPTFDGFYGYISYFLTNDTRAYTNSDGFFGTVSPTSEAGAWELAARYSEIDLNDGLVNGGQAEAITLAVNYYMTRDLRFQANYVISDSKRGLVSDNPNGLNLRLRFTW